jgi:hypothetical protein
MAVTRESGSVMAHAALTTSLIQHRTIARIDSLWTVRVLPHGPVPVRHGPHTQVNWFSFHAGSSAPLPPVARVRLRRHCRGQHSPRLREPSGLVADPFIERPLGIGPLDAGTVPVDLVTAHHSATKGCFCNKF